MSELRQLQNTFSTLLCHLIQWAKMEGYTVTIKEVYRPPETAALYASQGRGSANSLHIDSLAADLAIFKDGRYLTNSLDYKPLGDYWKSLEPYCSWGGDFHDRPDGNHFSLAYQGRR